jgi:ATP-dependent protease ClpP protease subunit
MDNSIFLTGIIDKWTADDLRWQLTNSKDKKIDLYLSTNGGSVNAGFEIANLIQGLQNKEIHIYNLSHADSIGTVIFLSAKKENRHIVENSTMFFHEPRFIVIDEVDQTKADKMSERLELEKNRIADFYVKNIEGLDKSEAFKLMEGEETLTNEKMLELGIVSEIMPAFEIAAQRNLITPNNKLNKMGILNFLNKKEDPINTLKTDDGKVLVHFGELKEGTEIAMDGQALEAGNIKLEDGKTLEISDKSIVNSIKEAAEPVDLSTPEKQLEAIAALIVDSEKRMETKIEETVNQRIEELRKNGGNHKPEKSDGVNNEVVIEDVQAQAAMDVQARIDFIKEKIEKERNQ